MAGFQFAYVYPKLGEKQPRLAEIPDIHRRIRQYQFGERAPK
jgi:hypothetical protein